MPENEHDHDEEESEYRHELSHELAERLLSCIDSFAAEKGRPSAALSVILLATEISASVTRRLCRDAGMPKGALKHLQGQASECAVPYYEERADIADDEEEAPTISPLMTPMTPKIAFSEIVTAFDDKTIGSKVLRREDFLAFLTAAIISHDPSQDRQGGQHFITFPGWLSSHGLVSSGVGPASTNPDHYVLRFHREKVSAYLKREFAAPVESIACVVYTLDAYRKDPDCTPAEIARVEAEGATHVIVAVLASAGPKVSPLMPFRLVHNLAGGNLEAQQYTAEEIRAKAKESHFHNAWSMVAD